MLTRALIVLLLVLNLGVAAWWLLRAPATVPGPAHPAGVPRLQLLSEAPLPSRPADPVVVVQASPADQAEPPADEASEAEPEPAQRCYALGPFGTAEAASAAQNALAPWVERAQGRDATRPGTGAWTVAIPPQADRAAAQAMADRIAAAGFSDYYILGDGPGANGIALGRFGSEPAAVRHQAALSAAGLPAQVQGPPPVTTRWIDVVAKPQTTLASVRAAAGGVGAQPVDCAPLG